MKVNISQTAIDQLQSLHLFSNLCLTTSQNLSPENSGPNHLILIGNVSDFTPYDQTINSHVGKIHLNSDSLRILAHDNEIDYDHYRQAFILLVDGQLVEDNIQVLDASLNTSPRKDTSL
ncbi:iron-sulfur cluster biosynthesis family protein [Aerococcus kribbianus]|uniref:Iron-sulfur cluster biosynthesis family protein n=1 Tax=Aerococcus kribbianus TaxID=2999064 RepID=A0A9X3JGH0_9LACT|nr:MULTISPECIES: iron-sulfur cluster biosynthesis family protein [unclassified Aerococcus]MCZ0717246.1 iron-sulfur cluster biosynthesis family protein [Aerococcus sp. YH-aer221]MCZ0725534.1 iron-sulfur cluster biosynthesis family protein [Aerococcus sp. YH-aer222]